jgi:DNA-3-methyladenine glycosylase II
MRVSKRVYSVISKGTDVGTVAKHVKEVKPARTTGRSLIGKSTRNKPLKEDDADDSPTLQSVLRKARDFPPTRGGWRVVDAMQHLVNANTKFQRLVRIHGVPEQFHKTSNTNVILPVPEGTTNEAYFSLLKIIIYQQLAATAAEPILSRFLVAVGYTASMDYLAVSELVQKAVFEVVQIEGKKKILVNGIVSGLSESKASYIKNLTEHFMDETKLRNVNLSLLSDEELKSKLLAIKGIGPWTVDIFMLFDLHRSNILPVGDLVVRKGIAQFHGLPTDYFEKKKNLPLIDDLCRDWAPYSSLAACYMWASKDSTVKSKKVETKNVSAVNVN